MSEYANPQSGAKPPEEERQTQLADPTLAEAFQTRTAALAETMPRSAEKIGGISGKAIEVGEKIKEGAIHAVDKAAADLPGEVKASKYPPGSIHKRVTNTVREASQNYDPTATAQKLAAKHGILQHYPDQDDLFSLVGELIGGPKPKTETREYKETVKATTEWQASFKERKIKETEKKIGEIEIGVPDVPEEDKAKFGEEEERAFWSDASQKLEALEGIAGKSVASKLGRLAGRRAIEQADKFVSPDHKSAVFKLELDKLDRLIEERGRHAHHRAGRLADIYERFPQTSPINYDDAEELKPIEKVIEDLRAAIASESYLPRLDQAVAKYVAKIRQSQGGANTALQAPKQPNYPPDVTQTVDAEIGALRGQGISDKDIRRKLAAKYHPDTNSVGEADRTNQMPGYVNEWYESVINDQQKK
jgi:hypothetical protein